MRLPRGPAPGVDASRRDRRPAPRRTVRVHQHRQEPRAVPPRRRPRRIVPLSYPATTAPLACASTITRPNCSTQVSVGLLGTSTTWADGRPPPVRRRSPSRNLDPIGDAERGRERAGRTAFVGPGPATMSRAGRTALTWARTRIASMSPFSGTSRPKQRRGRARRRSSDCVAGGEEPCRRSRVGVPRSAPANPFPRATDAACALQG